MGRWVTSKGRRIYIPDEGEKVPEKYKKNVNKGFSNLHGPDKSDPEGKKSMSEYSKEKTSDYLKKVGKKDSMELLKDISNNPEAKAELEKAFKEPGFKKEMTDATVAFIHSKHKLGQKKNDGVKDTINKNEDLKEKQIAANKAQKNVGSMKNTQTHKVPESVTDVKTHNDLVNKLNKSGLKLDSADAHSMQQSSYFNDTKVTMYDKDGNEYEGTYNKYSDGGREIIGIKKTKEGKGESLKKQINKDNDTKEKQIAANKAEKDKLNGKKEEFVVGNNPPTTKEQAYMNYKAIKISKNMPKEKQEELKRLKAKYRKEWKGR